MVLAFHARLGRPCNPVPVLRLLPRQGYDVALIL